MYDNRSAGELSMEAWNEVRGVVRKYDYLDIKNSLRQQLKLAMRDKLAELEGTFISRIKNTSEISTLKVKHSEFKTCNVEWVVNQFSFSLFPIEDYKIITQACDTCQSFNGLFNRVKEFEKGTLNSVHITQSELYGMHWLKQNKGRLKEMVFQDYKKILDSTKEQRSANYDKLI